MPFETTVISALPALSSALGGAFPLALDNLDANVTEQVTVDQLADYYETVFASTFAPYTHTHPVSALSDATDAGKAIVTLATPAAVSWLQVNTDGTVTALNAANTLAAIGGMANPMTTLGDIIYGGSSGSPGRLAGNTSGTNKFLRSVGSGGAATAPTFEQVAWTDISGKPTEASQSDMESIGTGTYVSPVAFRYHPLSPKCWVNFNGTGTLAIRTSYGISGVTDNGTADYTISFNNAFSSTDYMYSLYADIQINANNGPHFANITTVSIGSLRILTANASANPDCEVVTAVFWGDL